MANSSGFRGIIAIFIAAIICITFIMSISDNVSQQTQFQTVTNETVTITTARLPGNQINISVNFTLADAPQRVGKGALTSVTVKNASGFTISSTNYTANLNTGNVSFLNTTFMSAQAGNTTLVTYVAADDNYITDGASRQSVDLTLLLSVLGLIAAILGYIFRNQIKELLSRGR